MKQIGNLLMVIGLIVGCLAAATAYSPRTSMNASRFETTGPEGERDHVRMSQNAGGREKTAKELGALRARREADEITAEAYLRQREASEPIVTAVRTDETLSPDDRNRPVDEGVLASLRETTTDAQGHERPVAAFVKVKEFSFLRWPYAWAFGVGLAMLGGGAMMVRTATKREVALAERAPAADVVPPEQALNAVRDEIESLLQDLPRMPDEHARLHAIVERIGEAQRTNVAAFIDARARLISRMGLSGYAELMDRFAAMERQINRAWSAAADGVYEESIECLQNAAPLAFAAIERLERG